MDDPRDASGRQDQRAAGSKATRKWSMSQSPRIDLRPGVSEPVVLMISRREVEAADLTSVLSRLKAFPAVREDAWRYRGQMTLGKL